MPDAEWVQRVDSFWFLELDPAAWFKPYPELDGIIRTRFLATYADVAGSFDPALAAQSPERAVASVVVLDQFPRNMFRGTPRAFATDHLALAGARAAIERGLHKGLGKNRRLFLYLPFEHSEQLCDQLRAVELFEVLGDAEWLRFTVAHRDIIARFGRFPHRNAILGRASTAEEIAFLEQATNKFW